MESQRWGFPVILYHFTASRFLTGIQSEGISRGMTPIKFKGFQSLVMDQQWLTKKKDFFQEWCAWSSLPYDRTECRLTINIPKDFTTNLMDYEAYSKWLGENKIDHFYADDNNQFCEDVLDWVVYQGKIPRQWIRKIDYKKRLAA